MIPYLSSWNVGLPIIGSLSGRGHVIGWLVRCFMVSGKKSTENGSNYGSVVGDSAVFGFAFRPAVSTLPAAVGAGGESGGGGRSLGREEGKILWLTMVVTTVAAVSLFKFYAYPVVSYYQN